MHLFKLRTTASQLGQGSTAFASKHRQPETISGLVLWWVAHRYSWLILPFRSHRSRNCGLRSSVFHFLHTDRHLHKAGIDDRDNTCSPILSESLLHEASDVPALSFTIVPQWQCNARATNMYKSLSVLNTPTTYTKMDINSSNGTPNHQNWNNPKMQARLHETFWVMPRNGYTELLQTRHCSLLHKT